MLEIKYVRKNISKIEVALKNRGSSADLKSLIDCDAKRRELLLELETLKHKRNVVSDKIAELKKKGENADDIISEMKEVSSRIKTMDTEVAKFDKDIYDILVAIPNIPNETVPVGKNEIDNTLERKFGEPRQFSFEPKAHWTLGEDLKILNLECAAKITGARFPLYLGAGAKLERALINFMVDIHTEENGYTETLPPFIVNRNSMTNTGQLPKFEEDLFKIEGLDYFLIPTAEVPVTNIHQGEKLNEEDLPKKYVAWTPCFRSEAGSYGKDTRGLIRQHQFNKVELVWLTKPENSYKALQELLTHAEEILKRLELPYQVVNICTGDLGFSSARTYDLEVWMPYQNKYREISSCSNFEDFQARRTNLKFKRKDKKGTELVHTLNGSGLAVGRTVAAIMENYQREDGSIDIPKALVPYMGNMERIKL